MTSLIVLSTGQRLCGISALRKVLGHAPQAKPVVHRLFPEGIGRGRKIRIGEAPHRYAIQIRVPIALPIDVAAAIRTEMEPAREPAVRLARINLVVALNPHLALGIEGARMDDGAGAALASQTMADIDAVRLARGDHLE